MKYNGQEVKEANGEDYQLSPTPRKMLVWDHASVVAKEKEILGYHNGVWIAPYALGRGVEFYYHAAEIPTPTLRPFKSAKELDKAVIVHGPFVINVTTGTRMIISSYDNTSIRDHDNAKTMADMVNKFTFLDGAPFGVEEG